MKKKFLVIKFALLFIAFSLPFISIIQVKALENDKYNGKYTIEEMISKYNIVTLGQRENGNISKVAHIVGPILVEGNLGLSEWPSIDHSQQTYGISSYIKGKINSTGHAGLGSSNSPKFYVGKSNKVERYCELYNWGCTEENKYNFRINGFEYYTTYETIKDNEDIEYLDFEKLYNSIVLEQTKLEKGNLLVADEDGIINVKSGGVYTITNLDNINSINITDYNKDDLTLINIDIEGEIKNFPLVLMDGNQISTNDYIYKNGKEERYYGNIVFSLPSATKITFKQAPYIGHFVAPNADVEMPEMHFAGSFIVNSLTGSGSTEAHMYPYNLSNLPKESNKEVLGDTEEIPETYDKSNMYIFIFLTSIIGIFNLIIFVLKNNRKNA